MAFVGMIIEEVEQLAAQMEQKAQEIETIVSVLTSAFNSTSWVGPDKDMFGSDWQSTHVPLLHNTATALHEASQRAQANAQQQIAASQS